MKITVIVHQAEEGGYWAEVPAIPGCATQGETFEDLLRFPTFGQVLTSKGQITIS